jgi:hypothetical protein
LGSGEDRGVGYNGKLGRTGFRGVREFMGAFANDKQVIKGKGWA